MFRVETYLKETPKMGLGVFAKSKIKKGELIWEFVEGLDIKTHKSIIETLNPVQKEYVNKYFWKEGEYYYSSCDHSIFQNHSTNPNSVCDGPVKMIAARDIEKDEEIITNYSEFDDDFNNYKDKLI